VKQRRDRADETVREGKPNVRGRLQPATRGRIRWQRMWGGGRLAVRWQPSGGGWHGRDQGGLSEGASVVGILNRC
jgi:hypothetical protein